MLLTDLIKRTSIAFSLMAALSLPSKADEHPQEQVQQNLRVNPQKELLQQAIDYFEVTEIPRIRTRLRRRITLNDSYQIERKARVQVLLLNSGGLRVIENPGCFDTETVAVIKKFQKSNRIRPMDGAVGEATASALSQLGDFSLEEGVTLWPDASCSAPDTQLISEIQRNLMLLNFLPDNFTSGILDDDTVQAIRDYKRGNAINNADTIDSQLLNHLNLPSRERLIIMEGALRQHSRLRGDSENHIYVNIPEFKFRYYNNGKVQFEMDLVVGATRNRGLLSTKWHTNVQRGYVNNIIVNPWWNVPDGSLTREVREDMEKNRHLRENMQQLVDGRWIFDKENVVGRRFRYIPGPENPLGRVAYDIHGGEGEMIHGTPFMRLFNKTIREGSHGCMRSDHPIEFANRLMELGFFSSGSIDDYINLRDERTGFYRTSTIDLNRRVLVNVVYSLAWAENRRSGLVVFFPNDIYNYNRTIVIPAEDY